MLGGAALILFWGEDIPIASISLTHYSMVTNPTLPTVPLFTLAGYFLAEGGASKRLIRVFQALLGQIPRRSGHCHRPGVRLFHLFYRCVGRDYSRAGRTAPPGAHGRGLLRTSTLGC